jgi:polysaccharide pyruvyl transferase WcaK-like protein
MRNNMAILISGGNFINKGAEAMVLTLSKALTDWNKSLIQFCNTEIENSFVAISANMVPFPDTKNTFIKKIKNQWIPYRCKAMLDVGGYQFGDSWGKESIKIKLKAFHRWKRFGRQVMYLPQAWGPFKIPEVAIGTKHIIQNSDIVYIRDQYSFAEISKLFNHVPKHVFRGHDIAWLFEGKSINWAKNYLLEKFGLYHEKYPIFGISPNLRVYERSNKINNKNVYVSFIVELINWIIKKYDAYVILVGHEMNDIGLTNHDDRTLCNVIYAEIKNSDRVFIIQENLSASMIKGLLSCCDFCISSRYHALIAALSQNIPSVAISWSHKYKALMETIGCPSNVFEVTDDINSLKELVKYNLDNIDSIRSKISINTQKIKYDSLLVIKIY